MASELVHRTDLQFDVDRLRTAIDEVLAVYPFRRELGQLNLTSRDPEKQSPYDDSGSLYEIKEKRALHLEQEFKYFQKDLRGNYLHEIYESVNAFTGGTVGRVRLMRLLPRECYTFHKDDNVRYHLAVRTDPRCFVAFQSGLHHIPADGRLYRVDTTIPHTALNGGTAYRVHVVISTSSAPMKF